MKHVAVLLTLTAGLLALGPAAALAQSAAGASAAAPAGADGVLLQKALEANAQGNCPADLMAADLRTACLQQIVDIQPMMSAKGKITRLEFLGAQTNPAGQVETWLVVYEHGAQLWTISVGPDGKISGMFSKDD